MKLWIVTMNFPTLSETFAINDVQALKEAQVDVSVHALRSARPEAAKLSEQQLAGVKITHSDLFAVLEGLTVMLRRPELALHLLAWAFRHGSKHGRWSPEPLFKSLALLPRSLQLFNQLEREQPDVVHLFWGHYPAIFAYLVQRYYPGIISSVFLGAYDLKAGYGGSACVARRADVVWTHAQANVEDIKQLGVEESLVRVAYRGVKLARFKAVDWQRKVKRRMVAVGRLLPSKKMDDVLRVFQQTLARWPDATLVVLGDGSERESLKALSRSLGVEHAVTFRGHVAHSEVFEEMAKAEVFLLMSQHGSERLPNVVKEAMGCRCVCVTTQTPGVEELLTHSEHGFVVAQGDVASAAHHISEVFAEEVSAQRLTRAAYAHLEQNFDVDKTSAHYQNIWRTLIGQHIPLVAETVTIFSADRARDPLQDTAA